MKKYINTLAHLACVTLAAAEGSLRGNIGADTINKKARAHLERKLIIVGPDNRVKATSFIKKPPFTAVGIVIRGSSPCSGVLVGPDLVLTVQSCAVNKTSTDPLLFAPAYHDDTVPYTPARATEFFYEREKTMEIGSSITAMDVAFEWVVVKLDRPIGDEAGFWEPMVYDEQWNGQPKWFHMGYSSELDKGETVNPVFTNTTNTVFSVETQFYNEVEGYTMQTDIDTGRGQLGGKYHFFRSVSISPNNVPCFMSMFALQYSLLGPVFGIMSEDGTVTTETIRVIGTMTTVSNSLMGYNFAAGGPAMANKINELRGGTAAPSPVTQPPTTTTQPPTSPQATGGWNPFGTQPATTSAPGGGGGDGSGWPFNLRK